ncbi:heterokaryon incompatibility protein-domain-containing protein [Neurospora tetraspora]|uniref:Heterokaryon incompatibility protein-domain-containing protein n=1 Tax=Neurospora tetraspora TaxID=94610 RepID=A0AAE0J7S0_9PEZI|nr:heterokaryon incompatibility protein-domain-containing protein [Neurospora tetraspora]
MIPARLGEKPRYRALSYEWGLQDDQHDPVIMINSRYPLRVRKNLYEALKEIRASPGEFANYPLWIDAICIDQRQEYGEKPHQVRLMGKIFGQAALVIAWLGLAGRYSDLAIDALEACSQYGRLSLPKDCCFVTRILEPPEPKQTFDAYPPWMTMKAIMLLCNRSYCRRVWILQEIHMSRSLVVRCGSRSITDTDINRAFHTLKSFECIPHTRYKETHLRNYYGDLTKFLCITGSSVPLRHLQARENGHRSFGQWLQICVDGNFQATERRDYLFALLAISNDVRDLDIMVDYDVPLRTVMQKALPVIRRSYCVIKEDDRKSWDSFSREVDKLMGFHFERDPYTPHRSLTMSAHLEIHWYQRVFHYCKAVFRSAVAQLREGCLTYCRCAAIYLQQ